MGLAGQSLRLVRPDPARLADLPAPPGLQGLSVPAAPRHQYRPRVPADLGHPAIPAGLADLERQSDLLAPVHLPGQSHQACQDRPSRPEIPAALLVRYCQLRREAQSLHLHPYRPSGLVLQSRQSLQLVPAHQLHQDRPVALASPVCLADRQGQWLRSFQAAPAARSRPARQCRLLFPAVQARLVAPADP